jgi:DNA-binding MarR family transcriptional regulator
VAKSLTKSETRRNVVEELNTEIRAHQAMADAIDEVAAESLGVNRTDLRCLDLLDQRGPMSAGELARAAGVTTGAITGVVDRLEELGYARRVRDTADRRRVLVEFSPKAARAAAKIYQPLGEKFEELVSDYRTEELAVMRDFLRRGREISEQHVERMLASAKPRGSSSS